MKTIFLKDKTVIRNADDMLDLVPGSTVVYNSRLARLEWHPPKGGIILSGRKQRGKGDQSEKQEPLMHIKAKVFIQGQENSPWVFRENKDGIRFYNSDSGMHLVKMFKCGEDAVTLANGAIGFTATYCQFNAGSKPDKCIQGNGGDGMLISHCLFKGFRTAVQFGLTNYARKDWYYYASYNRFQRCDVAYKVIRGQLFFNPEDDSYGGAKNVTDNGGRLIGES